ncbi:FxSxx-COOH system tetratricopeptide repeat protein [Micromonospora mirobrigensis]|uniref:MinD-like ATPase involved in chromosome partitioning or flagellar assembly n=1 Tax=Micromonospora mirobrigensis TaxID=262898 RepID=A0A1C5A3Z9_9ACTN|nr:FxSxx-COOH system tetratricopeptide repeat protein [Micromonospora mirobrigensis]SCF39764.1 MinD-like ATPase involved in chromosome partitioning or flagellar assembly [Micromonospora mirobrigensis]
MSNDREGQVVTFYSFKGGTGRTMALANVAWILAANGRRVLVADWDLESPGLHRFFHPFLDAEAIQNTSGVIDMIRDYEWETTRTVDRPDRWVEQFARVGRHAFSLRWDFPDGGSLDFLSAGRQNSDYAVSVSGLDWDNFYNRLGGAQFFEALRADMKREYDYTLIDSRTGLSDVADICTLHLPDTLVDCFTLSDQGIEGAAGVARSVRDRFRRRPIRILPVPMRVDQAEKEKAEAGRSLAMRRFLGLPSGMTEPERRRYWAAVEVPYRPFYAYEETLATFGDPPGSPTSLLAAFETLTGILTDGEVSALPVMVESVRERGKARFRRRAEAVDDQIVLRYAPEDAVWAEWLERVLSSAGMRVVDPGSAVGSAATPAPRTLTVVSPAYLATPPGGLPPREPSTGSTALAVYVADLRPLAEFPAQSATHLVNVSAETAVERVLRLVGRPVPAAAQGAPAGGTRYPGADPIVFNAPNRNARFTGREDDLAELRRQLQSGRSAVVLPVALQGMGGVGKTQLALEYVYRYRGAYDVVWWIVADPPQFVDTALADLGARLDVPAGPTLPDSVRNTLQALGRGRPHERWLVVFDNAEELEHIEQFLPQGPTGHVLLTSRNRAWGERANPIQVDVFDRAESVAHLAQRVPAISAEEADRVADALGDLPIAVAAAGAWLAETGTPVPDYLRLIERHGPSALSVEATWDLSLNRLRDQAPAAYRLLQLCSVLAPEIALELIYSDEMAAALVPYDPAVSERLVRGALVQQINRLALLKLDVQGGRIQVHRLLQAVVRDRMTTEEVTEARHQVHLVLAASRPRGDVDDPGTWPRLRMLWPHLEVSEALTCPEETVRQLLIDRVRYLWQRGGLNQADEFSRRVDEIWSAQATGPDGGAALPRQLLHLRFNRANILRSLGRFTEARDLDETVLAEQRQLLGELHPHSLMTAGSLAGDLRALGRYAEALERDRSTYASWVQVLGEDDRRTLSAANNLAASYRLVGDYRSARRWDDEVHQRRRLVLGPTNPYTLLSAVRLGGDLREAGEYEKSVLLLREVYDRYVQVLGGEDQLTLVAQVNLAVSLRSVGRPADAAPMFEAAYRTLTERFGPTNPDTVACRSSRAANLLAVNDEARALSEMAAVARAYEEELHLGPTHPHTLATLSNRSAAERALGRRSEARGTAGRAVDELRKVLGPDHPHTLAAEVNHAVCLAEEGEWAPARDRLRDTAGRLTHAIGATHPDTLRCLGDLALVAGRADAGAAEADVDAAADRLAEVIGQEHPSVQTLRERRLVVRVIDPNPF